MADLTRHIGLSLGADVCWPLCYEALMERLDLHLPIGEDRVSFDVERVTIEPYDLRQSCKYDVVIDRLTHWYHTSREWIKKSIVMNDLYVFNNPWSVQSNEKHTSYCAMMKLGMPIPETWMIPPKSYEPGNPDLKPTLTRYAKLFDVTRLGNRMGWPMFMKPYDGGGWRAVTRVADEAAMAAAYEESGKSVMHVQAAVSDFDRFVRCIGFGPQTHCVLYDPDAPLHDRYTTKKDFISAAEEEHLRKVTLTINAFFGWEFNSCEALRKNGVWHPIDFANPCPDSQVTSLHYHFPWMVKAYVRWSVFCAATKRKMQKNLDWDPFYEVAAMDLSYEEKLDKYAALADAHFETARFEEFCATHLAHLDEVAWEFFGTDQAKSAVQQKVTALFPPHEIERFTELFWGRIQIWRSEQG
ncbi:MAG: hypothetical protein IPF92_16980 [Myxococcales bacterium]|nr:hypothetical protein [Myxococcales bacterium]MBL0195496.1 hypothetical protein [Myxococcales bacterium]HQY61690.1 hypothetical protein [Polyangiaceae bacterium]